MHRWHRGGVLVCLCALCGGVASETLEATRFQPWDCLMRQDAMVCREPLPEMERSSNYHTTESGSPIFIRSQVSASLVTSTGYGAGPA